MTARAAVDAAWEARARAMVDALGPLPHAVAAAMRRVPRHYFVPPQLAGEAYDDTPLPLGHPHSTISAPHMVALMLEWAELSAGLRVLEIGSGSGYLAALLAEMVGPRGKVIGIEIDASLAEESRTPLAELGYGDLVTIHAADGRDGWPTEAPYDRILVSFATPEIFPEWAGQLATPGILLAPVGPARVQVLRRLRRDRTGDRLEEGPPCIFVGLTSADARPK